MTSLKKGKRTVSVKPKGAQAARSGLGSMNLRCAGCGAEIKPSELHIDHIVPRSEGGTGDPSNLRFLCRRCNLLKTAQALSSVSNFGGFAAQIWARAFRRAPKVTSILSTFAAIFGAIAAIVIPSLDQDRPSSAAPFSEQMKVLDQTQASLQHLAQFVALQRTELEARQRTVIELQQQRKSLEPLVTADQRVVDALLRVQQQRAAKTAAHERWLGFGMGVLSSIVASTLLAGAGMFLKRIALRRR